MLAVIYSDGKTENFPESGELSLLADKVLAAPCPVTLILEDTVLNVHEQCLVAMDIFYGVCGKRDVTPEQKAALVTLAIVGEGSEEQYALAEHWADDFPVRFFP